MVVAIAELEFEDGLGTTELIGRCVYDVVIFDVRINVNKLFRKLTVGNTYQCSCQGKENISRKALEL